jgi:hypothetical protein
MGSLNSSGRLESAKFGSHVYVADAVFTDLPMAADG